jgi:S-adenosylmethionine/arginine decarboxylase-like enzyme
MPSDSVSGVLMLDGAHIVIHADPDRELLMLDALATASHDATKVVEVFVRRLAPREVRIDTRGRG